MNKTLKEASRGMLEVVQALASRNEPEELTRIRADNARLHGQVDALQAEVWAHRKEFTEMRAKAVVSSEMPSFSADT